MIAPGAAVTRQEPGEWLGTYFDDLEVGATLRTPGRTVLETDVVAFSALTGNRLGLDARPGPQRPGDAGSHYMLLLSYALGLLPIDPRCVIAVRELRDFSSHAPVRIGNTILVEGTVSSLTPLDEAIGLVRTRLAIVTERGKLLASGEVGALWRRRAEK